MKKIKSKDDTLFAAISRQLICLMIFGILTVAALLVNVKGAQAQIEHSTNTIDKDAAKNRIICSYIDDQNTLHITYSTNEKKKYMEYVSYSYRLPDFKLKNESHGKIEYEETNLFDPNCFKVFEADKEPRLLKAGTNLTGQLVLKRGKLEIRPFGRTVITKFVEEKKVKPKGVDGSKLELVIYRTESNRMKQLGNPWAMGNQISLGLGSVSVFALEKTKPFGSRYVTLVFKAETLEKEYEKYLEFDHPYQVISSKEMENGDFGVLFIPKNDYHFSLDKGKEAYNYAPNQQMFKFVRLSPRGDVIDEVDFEIPEGRVHRLYILESQDRVVIAGLSDTESEHFQAQSGALGTAGQSMGGPNFSLAKAPTHFTVAVIEDRKAKMVTQDDISDAYASIAAVENSAPKLPKPKNAQKDLWKGNTMFHSAEFSGRKLYISGKVDDMPMLLRTERGAIEHIYFAEEEFTKTTFHRLGSVGDQLYWIIAEEEDALEGDKGMRVVEINTAAESAAQLSVFPKKAMPEMIPVVIGPSGNMVLITRDSKELGLAHIEARR